MTGILWVEWVRYVDKWAKGNNRHIKLYADRFSGHLVPEGLTNVELFFFAPNLTSHVQPMDAGIIRNFKAHYRRLFIERALERYEAGITPSSIYEID